MRRRLAGAFLLLTLAIASAGSGCDAHAPSERASAVSQPIVGGDADPSDVAVVALVDVTTGALCSGTLVAPSLVLTAAHCLSGVPAAHLEVLVGGDVATPSQTVAVAAVATYPTYDSEADGIPGGVDLGVVTLAEALSIPPVDVRTDTTDAELTGATVDVIGYGANDGTGDMGAGTRRQVALTVTNVCSRLLEAGDADANACVGDSGGAVMLGGRLAAVVSGGRAGCAAPTAFTRTDAHAAWIQAVLTGGASAACPRCVEPDPSCAARTESTTGAGDASLDATDATDDAGAGLQFTAGGGCGMAGRAADGGFAGVLLAAALGLRRGRGSRRRRGRQRQRQR